MICFRFSLIVLYLFVALSIQAKNKYTYLGENSYAHGNYDNAVKFFKKAIENGEIRGEAHFFIGIILESQRKYKESVLFLMGAVARPLKYKYKKAGLWKLVFYFYRARDYENLIKYIKLASKAGIKSKKFDKMLDEAQTKVSPQQKIARKLIIKFNSWRDGFNLDKKNFTGSKKDFYLSQKEDISNQLINIKNILEAFPNKINFSIRGGMLAEKIAATPEMLFFYQHWYNKDDENFNAIYKYALALKKNQRYPDCIKYFRKVLKKTKSSSKLYQYSSLHLAQALYAEQNFRQSLKVISYAKRKNKKLGRLKISQKLTLCLAVIEYTKVSKKKKGKLLRSCLKYGNSISKNTDQIKLDKNVDYLKLFFAYKSSSYAQDMLKKRIRQKALKPLKRILFDDELVATNHSINDLKWLLKKTYSLKLYLYYNNDVELAKKLISWERPNQDQENFKSNIFFILKTFSNLSQANQYGKANQYLESHYKINDFVLDNYNELHQQYYFNLQELGKFQELVGFLKKLKVDNSTISMNITKKIEMMSEFSRFQKSQEYKDYINQKLKN